MQKIVINKSFGGFSISPKAIQRMAELNGHECHFYRYDSKGNYYKVSIEDIGNSLFYTAFKTGDETIIDRFNFTQNSWNNMSAEDRVTFNEDYSELELSSRPSDRSDRILIQVIEELGSEANGRCADLKIVEIPEGIEYTIEEYDGMEHITEVHRSWG